MSFYESRLNWETRQQRPNPVYRKSNKCMKGNRQNQKQSFEGING